MHKITFGLLWAFVFSLPFETFFVLFNSSFLTRVLGAATIAAAVVTSVASGRVRRPDAIVMLSAAFAFMSLLSLLWTVSLGATASRVFTYGQLVALVWLVREFAGTCAKQHLLISAYCLGGLVSITDLGRQFVTGQHSSERYSGSNLNPNDLALTLAIGIPMAWYLWLNRARVSNIIGAVYLPFAAGAILLTASRGAFIATGAALIFVVITVPFRSFRAVILSASILIGTIMIAVYFVPESSWNRIFTARDELVHGSISGRSEIWSAGLLAFQQQPLLGSGAGAFEHALEQNAHNLFIAILVEQGVVGLLLFCGLLGACGHAIYRLPPLERKLWTAIGMTWLLGVMTGAWQYRKITWLLVGLIAGHNSMHDSSPAAGARREVPGAALRARRRTAVKRYA